MKNSTKNQGLFFLAVIIICNSGSRLTANSYSEQVLSGNDSLIPFVKPAYREIYSIDYKWGEKIGKLKHDPSTKVEKYNFRLSDEGLDVRIEVYHNTNRIITVEKRTFDKNNVQLTLEAFDFTENNDCMSCTQWNDEEKMSYIYSMHLGTLIKYDVNCKLIELRPAQKKQLIQSVKVSLDSIMRHFPGYTYSFKWI